MLPGAPYAFDMGGGFVPSRRDVAYVPAREAAIAPLLDALEFVDDRQRWDVAAYIASFTAKPEAGKGDKTWNLADLARQTPAEVAARWAR